MLSQALNPPIPPTLSPPQVIFDYFYIPDHWADQRWGSGTFITKTVPFLRDYAKVKEFWLPNCRVMRDLLQEHEQFLRAKGLTWYFVGESWKNVLYVATEQVNGVMEASENEVKTNANQVGSQGWRVGGWNEARKAQIISNLIHSHKHLPPFPYRSR